jgi:hypothetical protein
MGGGVVRRSKSALPPVSRIARVASQVRRKDVLGMTLDALDVAAHAKPRGGRRSGFLYGMRSSALPPNVLKIGYSVNPQARAEQLMSTGTPTKFEVVFRLAVPDMVSAERAAFAALAPYRFGDPRSNGAPPEFFCVTPERAIEGIARALNVEPTDFWRAR